MNGTLTTRMRNGLKKLRDECDYEDRRLGETGNFITPDRIAPGIGEGTISKLLEMEFIEAGVERWQKSRGYRITMAGRKALLEPLPLKAPSAKRKLRELKPRIRER